MIILSPAQEKLLEELTHIAKIATDGSKQKLRNFRPRTSTLIIGPSGSGKTHLATILAQKLKIPCLRLNMASWILIGGRSEEWTWMTIVNWLGELTNGGILVLDEIDKLNNEDKNSEYTKFLRLELHDVLDSRIPAQIKIDLDEGRQGHSPSFWESVDREAVGNVLRERVLIVGCGAFQQSWIANQIPASTIGFAANNDRRPDIQPNGRIQPQDQKPPSREQILKNIDPELLQRFRDEVMILPPMTRKDYVHVANQIISQIPFEFRDAWNQHLEDAIDRAVEKTLGIRVFEELLLKAMIESRKQEKAAMPGRPQEKPEFPPINLEELLKEINSPRGQFI